MGSEARAMAKSGPASAAAGYDVERIRADFPILYREVHGKPLVISTAGRRRKSRAR